ncbi:hypothetical protein [Mesorhizobium sp. 1B3]|uniref:hypothetical protein n=1 Tax=Mesorhizobium sp. 1B3 TaxID=3243599 RepID=UPI003D969A28
MRTFVAKSGQTLQEISAELIDGRLGKTQAEAVLKRIRTLNPALGTGKLKQGTVVVLPAGPGIKTGPTRAVKQDPAEMLTAQFERAARQTRGDVAAAAKARQPERAKLADAFQSDAFNRALTVDRELAGKAELARKALAQEEADDKDLLDAFDGLISDARAAIEKLDKMLG